MSSVIPWLGPARNLSTSLIDLACVEAQTATLTSGGRRTALEVEPLNFVLADDAARDLLWRRYRQLLASLGGPVSLYVISRPLDQWSPPSPTTTAPDDPAGRDLEFTRDLVAGHRIQNQRHVTVVWARDVGVVPRNPLRALRRQPNCPAAAGSELEQRSQALLAGMGRLGLRGHHLDEGSWFALLQNCTGGRSGRPPAEFASWLAPGQVRVEPDLLAVDRRFCRSLQVSGFPRQLHLGWLAPLLLTPPCSLRLAEHIYPMPKLATLSHLRRRIRSFETSLQVDHLRGRRPDQGTRSALGDALNLEERVLLEEERLFGLGITITLEADSREHLDSSWHCVLSTLAEIGRTVTPVTHRQVDGWRATIPLGADPLEWKRDMTAGALAAAIPFMRAGLSGSEGALLGPSLVSRELVFVDPFAARNPNFNVVVLGTSGAGKSFTAKLLAARLLLQGVRIRCVDPAGEYHHLAALLGGDSWQLGSAPGSGLNPLGPAPKSADPVGAERRASQALPVLERLASPRSAGSHLDDADLEQLEAALLEVMRRDPAGACLRDLVATLHDAGARAMATRLHRFTVGLEQGFFDGASRAADSDFATISLRELRHDREHLLTALVTLVLVYLEAELEEQSGRPHLLLVDEAEVLLDSERSARALEGLTRRLRKLGAGLVVLSQVVEDFLTSPVGNVIIRNCHTKLLLRQEEVAMPALREAFGLSGVECDLLLSSDPGCGLIMVGGEHAAFRGEAPVEWLPALRTDALPPHPEVLS
ncbi:MAG: VirB4 family type IV secretion system protein [Candidatus Dormibacteria bacterium]